MYKRQGNNLVKEGYKVMNGDEDVTDKYSITPQSGTLTVTPREVIITAASDNFSYDGNPHSNDGYVAIGTVGMDAVSAVVEGSILYPSQSPVDNKIVSHTFTSGEESNYTVQYVDGSLTMEYGEQLEITITAASESFPYDGNTHSNTSVIVTEGNLIEGDQLVAESTGNVVNVIDLSRIHIYGCHKCSGRGKHHVPRSESGGKQGGKPCIHQR